MIFTIRLFIFTPMLKTINTKFIFFTTIFILLSVGIPTYFLIMQFRENFSQRSKVMLEITLDTFLAGLDDAMMLGEQKRIQHIIEKVSLIESVEHLRVFDMSGNIHFSTDTNEVGKEMKIVAPHHVREPLDQKKVFMLRDQDIYSVTVPIENKPECQNCHGDQPIIAYLDIDTDLTRAEINFYTGSVHIIFLAIAIIIILFFGFYFLFNFFINRPLGSFKRALKEVRNGNLNTRLPAKKEDEIGILEDHFNHMVTNLRESKEKIDELHFEDLQRADKLVTLGELAAEMAHEINNPAGIIMSRADYMQMDSKNDSRLKNYSEDLDVIINQVRKISTITSSILKYSKKLPEDYSRIDLKEVCEESLKILAPRITKNGIIVKKEYDSKNTMIQGDATQMEQVITNIINNALDAMDNDGVLTIGIKDLDNDRISCFIRDSGYGMEKTIREQIFSPFFTTKSADTGTGLGLYIVKNICKNHNVEIKCESEAGKGTVFNLLFPLTENAND